MGIMTASLSSEMRPLRTISMPAEAPLVRKTLAG